MNKTNNFGIDNLLGDPTFFWRLIAVIILIALATGFILVAIRLLLEHRIKNRIIEKVLPEATAKAILNSGESALKAALLKWFLVFAGIACGLFIVAALHPDEVTSLAIITACIAGSFGTCYLLKKENDSKMKRILLVPGIACPILFWLTTLLCGGVNGQYNQVSVAISDLGALGSKAQHLFSVLLLLFAALGIGFCIGLFRVCREKALNLLPIIPTLIFFLGNAGMALFPLGDDRHPVAGQTTMAVIFSPILALWNWRKTILLTFPLQPCFFITALVAVLSGLLPGSFVGAHAGLLQRIYHAG